MNNCQSRNEAELALKYCHDVHVVLSSEISGFLGPSRGMLRVFQQKRKTPSQADLKVRLVKVSSLQRMY